MKIIDKEISGRGQKRIVISLTKNELDILYGVVKKAYLHTPKVFGHEKLAMRLKNMKVAMGNFIKEMKEFKPNYNDKQENIQSICVHCGSNKGTWFDRSITLDAEGNEIQEETYPNRCLDCGCNIDAPQEYYKINKE